MYSARPKKKKKMLWVLHLGLTGHWRNTCRVYIYTLAKQFDFPGLVISYYFILFFK